ncbi:MAG: TadE/TadG family type IV pilus assembly protein [Terriglobales bacterium]
MGIAGRLRSLEVSSRRTLRDVEGSSLVEFAISLPLLVVLVVGIFDFGGAFNQKQMLNNAVREGARFGSSQPTNDLCTGCSAPPSVDAIRSLVDSYLLSARVNDCGLSSAAIPGAGPPWVYTANSGCAGTMTLTINRAVALPETISGTTVNLLCTQVSVSYPYQWHFNNVIQLVAPGANFGGVAITTSATAVNMD